MLKNLKCATIIHLWITWITLLGSRRRDTKSTIGNCWLNNANSSSHSIITCGCSSCCNKSILWIPGEFFFLFFFFFTLFSDGIFVDFFFLFFLWYWFDIVIIISKYILYSYYIQVRPTSSDRLAWLIFWFNS